MFQFSTTVLLNCRKFGFSILHAHDIMMRSFAKNSGCGCSWLPHPSFYEVYQCEVLLFDLDRLRNFAGFRGEWLPSILNFPINIGFHSSSQLTNSYFSEGWPKTTGPISPGKDGEGEERWVGTQVESP